MEKQLAQEIAADTLAEQQWLAEHAKFRRILLSSVVRFSVE